MNTELMKYYTKLLWVVSVAAGLTGCASAPSHFYTLNSTAKADGAPRPACSVVVGPVFIPGSIDRPQFVVATSPNRVEFDEFNRWAEPLSENIAAVVSADLGTLLGTKRTASAPMPDFGPAYHVTIRIEHLEFVRGTGKTAGEAQVDAFWAVRNPADQNVDSGHTLAREPVQDSESEALVAAYSRALAKVSGDIANAIRPAAGGNQ
jgi:uncharacterized lipoprotein YmbA